MSQTIEEITQNIGTTGEAFDDAVDAAITVLGQINGALSPYRNKLPSALRDVVDAISKMQAEGGAK